MTDVNELPDWVSPPGETILDILEERGWSQAELAERSGFTRKHINQLIKGNASINEETALKLERVLGSTAGFWLTREAQFRETIARQSELDDLKVYAPWLHELPVADMVCHGWIRKFSDKSRQIAECLQFFGVANVDAWKEKYESVVLAYRAPAMLEKKQGSVSAWLRCGEREAETASCSSFKKAVLEANLQKMRSLTCEENPEVFISSLKALCCASGIVLAVVPSPKGCPVSGVTRWLQSDKALVMLSLRYKSNDQFWFTFFHEIAHLVLHGKRMLFLEGLHDGLDDQLEDEANRWAANFLIPGSAEKRLHVIERSASGIVEFAKEIGIAPGIIVGRMQKEKMIPWNSLLTSLKVYYTWKEEEVLSSGVNQ